MLVRDDFSMAGSPELHPGILGICDGEARVGRASGNTRQSKSEFYNTSFATSTIYSAPASPEKAQPRSEQLSRSMAIPAEGISLDDRQIQAIHMGVRLRFSAGNRNWEEVGASAFEMRYN